MLQQFRQMDETYLKSYAIPRGSRWKPNDLIAKSYSRTKQIIFSTEAHPHELFDKFRKTQFKLRKNNQSPNIDKMNNLNCTTAVFPLVSFNHESFKIKQKTHVKKRRGNSIKQKVLHIQKSPYLSKNSEIDKMLRLLVPVHGPNQSLKLQIKKHNQVNIKNAQLLIVKKSQNLIDRMKAYNKRMSLPEQTKIYKFNSQDSHIRNALQKRGWKESTDINSVLFHLKWVYKDKPNDYVALQEGQWYNHFKNNQELTNKNYLRKNIKNKLKEFQPNFPLSFDLDYSNDLHDFQQVFSDFQSLKLLVELAKVIKQQYPNLHKRAVNNSIHFINRKFVFKSSQKLKINELLFNLTPQNVPIKHKWQQFYHNLFDFICVTASIIGKQRRIKYSIFNKTNYDRKKVQIYLTSFLRNKNVEPFTICTSFYLTQILKLCFYTQNIINKGYGSSNSWIIKPTGISRGLGITITDDFQKISSNKHGKIIQKYIENPYLLSCGRKFDIRQWVLVKSFDPLKVYIYRRCYARFSSEIYSNNKYDNLSKHLTNYSQNKSSFAKQNSTYIRQAETYSAMSEQDLSLNIPQWNQIKKSIMVQIMKTLNCCKDEIAQMDSCFQVFGFDVLLDSTLKPYILQVNLSPACQERQFLSNYLKQMAEGLIDMLQGAYPTNWAQLMEDTYMNQAQMIEKHKKNKEFIIKIQKWWRKKLILIKVPKQMKRQRFQ